MPRLARLDAPGVLHHIIIRGIERRKIFRDDKDRDNFIDRLSVLLPETQTACYAWAFIPNHAHFLFRSGIAGISTLMRRLLTGYAIYFNRRHKRTGHLFENRYKSILCEEDRYLLALIRYIHLNPIRVGVMETVKDLDAYSWSGHSAVIGRESRLWMDTEYVLLQFGDKAGLAKKEYRRLINEGVLTEPERELEGEGPACSCDGWSNVVSKKRKGRSGESDERILGSRLFINEVLEESEENEKRQLKLRRNGTTIDIIIDEECEICGINQTELREGCRRTAVSNMRAKIAWRCVNELGLSMADIARNLRLNNSSVARVIEKMRNEKKMNYAT